MILVCAIAALVWPAAHAANPQISKQSPLQAQNTTTPIIAASFTPAAGGGEIDTRRVSLVLDGVDVVEQATVSTSGISYKPPKPLVEGRHSVSLLVGDKSGNFGTANWSFVIDVHEPVISAQEPKGVDNANPRTAISASYTDKGGPINPANVRMQLDDVDVSAAAVKTASTIKYQPSAPWLRGRTPSS
ncbi:Ig-like domain-containing protein [Massilia sp. MB5]|uniref:Ig-like domain-containing protein n=1 Tax=Massilia sp. MB5 TaxID=2919578 RepID=UPI001F10917F|nr:Ig-like domain-containing protein [Massilia sp. MB5]UMR32589.1 Ig-like domain-containing protein [Massilia sp. MB5]